MSRFAKLVNAKVARGEQESTREFPQQQPTLERFPVEQETEPQQVTQTTPVATGVVTPVATPVATPPPTPVDEAKEKDQNRYLDATHTASEARVYSVMYRETISKGLQERHFGPKELSEKTGIRSDRTIRTALQGLSEKLSIEVLWNVNGNPLGPRYRVYEPREIIRRRKGLGIEIDPQSKKIIGVSTPVATTVATPVGGGGKNYRGTPVKITGVTPVNSTGVYYKYINTNSTLRESATSSSSKSTRDDDNASFLDSIREVYERATGNAWTTADSLTAQKGNDIPSSVWGIAICHCVDRAPNHRFDRLAYVSTEAREHAEAMKDYSESDLRVILRHSLRQIERARSTGKWTVAEIENEEAL
jgi:hypothetical protein